MLVAPTHKLLIRHLDPDWILKHPLFFQHALSGQPEESPEGGFRQHLPLRPLGGCEAASLMLAHWYITGFVLRLHEAPGRTDGGFGTLYEITDICETAAAGV